MRFSGLPVVLLAVALVYSVGIPAQTSAAGQSPSRQSPPLSSNQTVITNRDVVSMVKAGLAPEIVATKVKNSNCQCDTSPAALAELKTSGVPDNVILAMVQKTTSPLEKTTAPAEKPSGLTNIRNAKLSPNQNGSPAHQTSRPKSIYVDAPPDAAPIKKQILAKLQAWGEISAVNLPEQADLILELVQSGKLNAFSGSGDRGSVVLKNRRTGEELWTESRGGGWSMRGWSNAAVGRKLGDDLINFLRENRVQINAPETSKHD